VWIGKAIVKYGMQTPETPEGEQDIPVNPGFRVLSLDLAQAALDFLLPKCWRARLASQWRQRRDDNAILAHVP
jgi:hypothetical protein